MALGSPCYQTNTIPYENLKDLVSKVLNNMLGAYYTLAAMPPGTIPSDEAIEMLGDVWDAIYGGHTHDWTSYFDLGATNESPIADLENPRVQEVSACYHRMAKHLFEQYEEEEKFDKAMVFLVLFDFLSQIFALDPALGCSHEEQTFSGEDATEQAFSKIFKDLKYEIEHDDTRDIVIPDVVTLSCRGIEALQSRAPSGNGLSEGESEPQPSSQPSHNARETDVEPTFNQEARHEEDGANVEAMPTRGTAATGAGGDIMIAEASEASEASEVEPVAAAAAGEANETPNCCTLLWRLLCGREQVVPIDNRVADSDEEPDHDLGV